MMNIMNNLKNIMNIMKNLKKDIKKKAVKYFILHFGAVFIFAFLYWISDVIEAKYPKFARKYLGVTKKLNKEWANADTFWYYLWYSLITQTTVGYGGVLNNKGTSIPIIDLDYPFKILNYLQLFSIFTIPIISLIWG